MLISRRLFRRRPIRRRPIRRKLPGRERLAFALLLVTSMLGGCDRPKLLDLAQQECAPGRLDGAAPAAERVSKVEIHVADLELSGHKLRDRALAHLARRQPRAAVAVLRQWTSTERESAVAWNDLSAAWLAWAHQNDEPGRALEALAAATRALAIEPGLGAAAQNQRVAARHLGLVDQDRSETAKAPTTYEWWQQEISRASGPPTDAQLESWFTRAPGLARRHLEEKVFSEWALASSLDQAREAERYLESLQEAARLQRSRFADTTLTRALSALDRDPAVAAQAHRAYSHGVAAYERPAFTEATAKLEEARDLFVSIESPFADLAELYLGIMAFRLSPEQAYDQLEALGQRIDAGQSPWLAGRIAWLLGTLEGQKGEYRHALALYRRAAPGLKASGDPALYAFTDVLIAEVRDLMGLSDSWTYRIRALRALAHHGNPRRRMAALQEAINTLEREDRIELSLAFTDELLAHTEKWGNDLGVLAAHTQKARALSLTGRHGAAAEALGKARGLLENLEAGTIREGERAELEIVEAILATEEDPRAADLALTAALDKRRDIHFHYDEETLLYWRARARRRGADPGGAEQDLRAAIERHSELANDLSAVHRVARLVAARSAFSELAELQLEQGHTEEALLTVDAMNSLPFEHLRGPRTAAPLSLAALRWALPGKARFVELLPLDEELVVFIVDAPNEESGDLEVGGLSVMTLPLPKRTLEELTHSLAELIRVKAESAEIRDLAALLSSQLQELRPRSGGPLIIVATEPLGALPFGALFDAHSQRYWIEDHAISIMDSARSVVLASRRSRAAAHRPLIVGIDRAARWRDQVFPALPHIAVEVARASALAPQAQLLLNEEASAEKVLAELADASVLYWAGHAVYSAAAPSASGLVLVGHESQGELLELDRIAAIESPLEVAILSSCSAMASSGAGPLSIAAAWPKTPDVLASFWTLEDAAAAQIGPRVLAKVSEQPLAFAYREALLEAWEEGVISRHPSAWAGYAVVGGLWFSISR